MFTPGSPLPSLAIPVRTITVSADADSTKRVNRLLGIQVNDKLYTLSHVEDGKVSHEFTNPITLSSNDQVLLHYKKLLLQWKGSSSKLDIQRLFASARDPETQDLSVTQDGMRVTISRESTGSTPFAAIYPSDDTLVATTPAILDNCPRFRILVIGKSGVGKSSLIKAAFGIEKASSANLERGKADISEGLVSPANDRFILHDSLGFEPGDHDNYGTVKNFIQSRQNVPLRDRIHAVWFCIPLPHAGGRLLEAAAEDFFRSKQQIMGTTPLIVVLTKLDIRVAGLTMHSVNARPGNSNFTEVARSQAESLVQQRREEISRLTGERELLPFATVSTEADYRDTLHKLIELTDKEVGKSLPFEAQIVTRMAQRIDRHLKIQGSINVGKQRYWRALRTSPHFARHTIWDCLSVIHTDVVNAWNFNDPARRLLDKEFKELVIELVQEMQTKPIKDTKKIFALAGSSLLAAAPALVAAIANPAVPIILPVVVTIITAVWLYKVYKNVKNVQQIFMVFIVDLTFIMETLFVLTAPNHHRLTRRAIKLAYKTYYESDVRCQVHAHIQSYRDIDGRDSALETIESLILPKDNKSSDVDDYYAGIRKVDREQLNLDREEAWKLDADTQ